MGKLITGIHHVTALASDAQRNIDFYTGILGMRMVKKTVNFDAPEVYHLYYGNQYGSPGSILTFFPYSGLVRGRHGKGYVNTTTLAVPYASLDYWLNRLRRFQVLHKEPQERFQQEVVVYLEDPDGLGLELVFNDADNRPGFNYGPVPPEHAIKGFYNVEIWQDSSERTAVVLTEQLDHTLVAEKGNRFRFAAQDAPGQYVDIMTTPESARGLNGSGTVHHIAFSTPDQESESRLREKLESRGLDPTPIKDRQYFKSVYFREPGGVLFEVATAGPGFAVDEDQEHLGEALKLPPWYEKDRLKIESSIKPVSLNLKNFV